MHNVVEIHCFEMYAKAYDVFLFKPMLLILLQNVTQELKTKILLNNLFVNLQVSVITNTSQKSQISLE